MHDGVVTLQSDHRQGEDRQLARQQRQEPRHLTPRTQLPPDGVLLELTWKNNNFTFTNVTDKADYSTVVYFVNSIQSSLLSCGALGKLSTLDHIN